MPVKTGSVGIKCKVLWKTIALAIPAVGRVSVPRLFLYMNNNLSYAKHVKVVDGTCAEMTIKKCRRSQCERRRFA